MAFPPPRGTRACSERLYRLLLQAYPRAFRQEYAAEMLLAFRDAYREASERKGTLGVLGLWRVFLGDYVTTVCIQHVTSWMERAERDFALAGKEPIAMT